MKYGCAGSSIISTSTSSGEVPENDMPVAGEDLAVLVVHLVPVPVPLADVGSP